jgi:hypothetical protein
MMPSRYNNGSAQCHHIHASGNSAKDEEMNNEYQKMKLKYEICSGQKTMIDHLHIHGIISFTIDFDLLMFAGHKTFTNITAKSKWLLHLCLLLARAASGK